MPSGVTVGLGCRPLLCQPLDGKPFMALEQAFKKQNIRLSWLLGHPIGKADFLRIIGPVREQALKKSTIQAAFRERGVWPPNGPGAQAIIKKLEDRQPPVPDIEVPEYAYTGEAGLRPACIRQHVCIHQRQHIQF